LSKKINNSKKKAKVTFLGESSNQVSGSMYLVEYNNSSLLLDCGLHQCNSKLEQYKENNRNLKFKVKKIEYIIISHKHLDHIGMLPILYYRGCKAKIYMPKNSKDYIEIALKDSLKIMESDVDYLNKISKKNTKYKYLFDKNSIQKVLDSIVEVDFNEKIQLNEYFKIRFSSAYHIFNSAQIELFIKDKDKNYRKKIIYTGDLGNIRLKNKPFLDKFEKLQNCDLLIGETTYALNKRKADNKTRIKDKEKIISLVEEVQNSNKNGNIIFASFAYQRSQEILLFLYDIYHNDKNFKMDILLDSPLAIKVVDYFIKNCNEEDSKKLSKVLEWKNVKLVKDWQTSKQYQNDKNKKIVISSSGFMNNGRITDWIKNDLPNKNSYFVFVGYSSPESIATQIKDDKKAILNINGYKVKCNAKVANLLSFSSHMQHDDLLEYYTSINCEIVSLVHGEIKNRFKFSKLLEEEYRNKNKTTKVVIVDKNRSITL